MMTLERLESLSLAERCAVLFPADYLLSHLKRIDLDDQAAQRLVQGQRLPPAVHGFTLRLAQVRLYRADGQLLGTGSIDERGVLAAQRLMAQTSY